MTVEDGGTEPVVITDLEEARDAYRHKDLRQALYDGGEVMAGVLVNLHGDEHRARRRLENRLFRRETLLHYERELFPAVIAGTLEPHVARGRAELVQLGHQMMMNLAALNAGIDRPLGTPEETFRLYGHMMKFVEGATVAHSTRDQAEVEAEVRGALARFAEEFLDSSLRRRAAALERFRAGEIPAEELPRDVLTVLLRNEDDLHLPRDVVLREVAFFLLAGAHTSATAFTRTLDNALGWIEEHPEDEARLADDRFVQRCVHETVRLAPSSPVAARRALRDVVLRSSGRRIPAGARVAIDLVAINRDESVFGEGAERFDPHRRVAEHAPPYGLSFGHGMHACIGQELAAGALLPDAERDPAERQHGLVAAAVRAAFDRGVRRDPEDPPVWDATTRRPYWARYPVVFARRGRRS